MSISLSLSIDSCDAVSTGENLSIAADASISREQNVGTHPVDLLFAQIVLPRLHDAYRLALWMTGSATDAEDVVQEACLRAHRSIDTFAKGNARAWFLTIVRNSCYTWLRERRLTIATFIDDLDPVSRASLDSWTSNQAQQTPEDVLIAKTEAARLVSAIETLPSLLREALVLREYQELSYREIAEVTAVPIGTVMSRLANGRKRLVSWANGTRGQVVASTSG